MLVFDGTIGVGLRVTREGNHQMVLWCARHIRPQNGLPYRRFDGVVLRGSSVKEPGFRRCTFILELAPRGAT